jgi:hypothetical protein
VVKLHDVHRLAGLTTEPTPTVDEVRAKRIASIDKAMAEHEANNGR